ncbi:calcium-activated potassium channel subunit alpha-1-like [Bombina bombina]|uniref:calcium-activated potassium channel subunit alpha-1-like n=1 Tax=Bombina bombina TaxID=8345 RepID=UPI00235A7644|nr:calcium-activated potassium channel subunit alpha-1-like [Bombina bombina]
MAVNTWVQCSSICFTFTLTLFYAEKQPYTFIITRCAPEIACLPSFLEQTSQGTILQPVCNMFSYELYHQMLILREEKCPGTARDAFKFIAAKNKLKFWLELNSLVDFFTIPPVCVSIYLGKNWLGRIFHQIRFLRAVRLIELPKILQLLKITKTGTAIKLSNLLAVFLSTWLTAAGFLHLLENTGDPWTGRTNRQHITYFDCIYLLMVTMSTVGYGDITAKTVMGRIFLLFFIVVGLALFAHHVPEIMDIVGSNRKFDGLHVSVGGRKHIVVCGYITVDSVTSLLRNFKHEDRGKISTDILFMEEIKPNLDLEAVFKCNKFQITFFHGSVLSFQDLKRVKMEFASACIVLADKCCANPEHEDMSNIMRVISIKNYYPQVRIIIQILKSHNKRYLQNIPAWDSARGDSIICLAELKLGILAQSCLVPGFSTVLINLCSMKYNLKMEQPYDELRKSMLKDLLEASGKVTGKKSKAAIIAELMEGDRANEPTGGSDSDQSSEQPREALMGKTVMSKVQREIQW